MNFKQSTIQDILDSEREMVMKGTERFGEFYINAAEFNNLLSDFLKSVSFDRFIFTAFLSHIRKHHTLALFSVVRLHHVQAMLDLRQVLEAGAWAAYSIANPEKEKFADVDEHGFLNISDRLTDIRNKWLEENFPGGSQSIVNMKKNINKSAAHANIIQAHQNFEFDEKNKRFDTPFFDFEDEYRVQTNLWTIGNIAMGLVDLFYGINKEFDALKFIDNFVPYLNKLEKENHELKDKLQKHPRSEHIRKITRKS